MSNSPEQDPRDQDEGQGDESQQWHLPGQPGPGSPTDGYPPHPPHGYPPQGPPPGYPPQGPPHGYSPQGPPSAAYHHPGQPYPGQPYPGYQPHGYPPHMGYVPPKSTELSFGAEVGIGVLVGFLFAGGIFVVLFATIWTMGMLPTVITGGLTAGAAVVGMFFDKTRGYSTGALIALAISWIVLLGPCLFIFNF